MSFTPGPWHVDEHPSYPDFILDKDGKIIASAEDNGHLTENARLIAAAPDLLTELQILADSMTGLRRSLGLGLETPEDSRARAAIAKATETEVPT